MTFKRLIVSCVCILLFSAQGNEVAAELTGYNLDTGEIDCDKGNGGKTCTCPLNTDPMQGAKASTIVLGETQTRVEGGVLYLHIEQSPMLVKTKMTLGLDIADETTSATCSGLFTWTLSTADCSNNIFVGEANFAEVLAKCNPDQKNTDEDNDSGGKDAMTELTFHFNVNNERDVKITPDVWKPQVTTTYMPVRVSLQKTFTATTTAITVEEIVQRFLRIELKNTGDATDTDLIDAAIADLQEALKADTDAPDYREKNVNVNKIGNDMVIMILLVPEADKGIVESVDMNNLVGVDGVDEDNYSIAKEVITSVIAPSGVMEVTTSRTSAEGIPELDLLLYAQAGYPYVLTVAEQGAEYPPDILPVETDGNWAVRPENNDNACVDDNDACGTYFTLTAYDANNAKSFTGVYKVVLNVACEANFFSTSPEKCAVFGREMTVSLLFTIETGSHEPQVLGDVILQGGLTTTAIDYYDPNSPDQAQVMTAFLNDEVLYTVATVTSEQAQLTSAEVILASISGTVEGSVQGTVILFKKASGGLTPEGLGVEFASEAGTPDGKIQTAAGESLYPKFRFKTNMTVLDMLNKQDASDDIGRGADGFQVSVTLLVGYDGLPSDRRLLTTTRRLLAPANEVVAASQGSVALTSATLVGANPVKKTDGGINAGASVLPGSGVLALLVAMVCVALH